MKMKIQLYGVVLDGVVQLYGVVQQNELLLNAMIEKTRDHQLMFLEALNDTKQSHLVTFVNKDGTGEQFFRKRKNK